MTRGSLGVLAAGVALVALAASSLRAEDQTVRVLVETADGCIFAGTLPAATELRLRDDGKETKIPLKDVRRLYVSTVREEETAALEAKVLGLRDRLADEDAKVRGAASDALLALPGSAAPFMKRLAKDRDPEVVLRAKAALEALARKGDLRDSRDLVVTKTGVLRGWLELDALELRTARGTETLARREIRTVRRERVRADASGDLGEGDWLPPLAVRPVELPLQVVVHLDDGSQLVGVVPANALALVDKEGKKLCSDHVLALSRDDDAPGAFQVQRDGVPAFRASLAAKELTIAGAARTFQVAVSSIESLTVGAFHFAADVGSFADLVRRFLDAKASGASPPATRFWVSINDQKANPWDSDAKLGMTWALLDVKKDAALVGADDKTNAYKGDISIDESLPILCVRKFDLAAPEGIDDQDFYNGWSGAELRMTKPVAGSKLSSLEEANAIVKAQLGEGWEMAEFHKPNGGGGWHWWGYWKVPGKGK